MSISRPNRAIGPALALALAAGAALAQASGAIHVSHARIPQPPLGAPTAAGYVAVTNVGRAPERLTGAASPCCERVELHLMSMAGGVMSMRPAPEGVVVAPGATLDLSPNGYHLMLLHPHQPLRAGEHVPVTLRFQHAPAVTADFLVQGR